MPDLKQIPVLDTAIKPEQNAWSSLPAGFLLLIEEGPDRYLLIDDEGNRLLVE